MTWIFLKESKIWWKLPDRINIFQKNRQTIIHRGPECYRCKNTIYMYPKQTWKDLKYNYGYLYNNEMYCKYCYDIIYNNTNIVHYLLKREIISKKLLF